uniref:Uncharacterized protein n=1 Tax=Mustela putorius furo TaxID=9669 RepID=M3Y9U5_MUSPF
STCSEGGRGAHVLTGPQGTGRTAFLSGALPSPRQPHGGAGAGGAGEGEDGPHPGPGAVGHTLPTPLRKLFPPSSASRGHCFSSNRKGTSSRYGELEGVLCAEGLRGARVPEIR